MSHRHLFPAAALAFALAPGLSAQRPAITGVAHISLKTNDLVAARAFYRDELGFAEPFPADPLAVFKVNDRQYIEVAPVLKEQNEDRLSHIAFETADARRLRDYLESRAVAVPKTVAPDKDGNLSFTIEDPDGHTVEFIQYLPGSIQSRTFGKSLPATRISQRIIHVGFTVRNREAEDRLYKDILGFHETWHGGKTDDVADWIDMRVPDGTDWLEYMLNVNNPSPRTRGVMNHLALGVPSVEQGYKALLGRGANLGTEKPKIGRDGKWQLNLYDPNLTRTELMEPKPVQTPCCSPIIE